MRTDRNAESLARDVLDAPGASVVAAVLALLALLSIWLDDAQRLTTGLGLFSAGLVFALQIVVTALAGYVVIMRGNTFTVGDRITMGGVRGDVIALTFTQNEDHGDE